MCIFNILQVQSKLKAAVTVIVGDDIKMIEKIEE